MRRPLVSILVPVYNVEEELKRCLDTLIRQTIEDIEIICVNDGSTDNSLQILKQYQQKDSRIIIVDKENGGLPSARNAGLDRAMGKYVGFVDADDYVELDMFEKLYQTAEKEHSEIVICGAHIFPEEPKADDWYYATLSPHYEHYDKCEPSVIFENIHTTPFLWRVFVLRNVMERKRLRLDETVSLGEDKAFQTKLYREAEGITVIPDKLYHYCWRREGSIMQSVVKNVANKVKGHAKLIKHIAEIIKEDDDKQKTAFLKWSIPLIYADYISIPFDVKIELAFELIDTWNDIGYKTLSYELEQWIHEQYQYIEEISGESSQVGNDLLSVILVADENAEYIEDIFTSLNEQTLNNVEIIVINSGASDKTYAVLHKNLFKNKKIRLWNMERRKYSEAINIGIQMAIGNYITICSSDGWYAAKTTLEEWYIHAVKTHSDMCLGLPQTADSGWLYLNNAGVSNNVNLSKLDYYKCDYRNFIINKMFLKQKNIIMHEAAVLSGTFFVTECIMAADNIIFWNKVSYVKRNKWIKDWISTEQCEELLEMLADLLRKSVEAEDAYAHAYLLDLLNADYYKKLILNNTKLYAMPEWQCPNGENSQKKTILALYEIMSLIDSELLERHEVSVNRGYLALLPEMIAMQHKYMADISGNGNR